MARTRTWLRTGLGSVVDRLPSPHVRAAAYRVYGKRLVAAIPADRRPRHVAVLLDGNRRWARSVGEDAATGHRAGGEKVEQFVGWCDEAGIELVTLWLLSTDNIRTRHVDELAPLVSIISETVRRLAGTGRWRVNLMGDLDLLPAEAAVELKTAVAESEGLPGMVVNVAVGYGGRQEITDAVRSLLREHASAGTSLEALAEILDVEHIAGHLYTRGQPDPDLIIRTSGEQRMSGFLIWQSVHSELYFCEAYWPAFREVDFQRALRSYALRHRRFGG